MRFDTFMQITSKWLLVIITTGIYQQDKCLAYTFHIFIAAINFYSIVGSGITAISVCTLGLHLRGGGADPHVRCTLDTRINIVPFTIIFKLHRTGTSLCVTSEDVRSHSSVTLCNRWGGAICIYGSTHISVTKVYGPTIFALQEGGV